MVSGSSCFANAGGRLFEIGAGLGDLAGKIWRIGLMGYGSSQKNVLLCVSALDALLRDFTGHKAGEAVQAVRRAYGAVISRDGVYAA